MNKKNNRGFTLVEIIVTLTVLAILAAIAYPAVTNYMDDARISDYEAQGHQILVIAQKQARRYKENDKLQDVIDHKAAYSTFKQDVATALQEKGYDGTLISINLTDKNPYVSFFDYKIKDVDKYVKYQSDDERTVWVEDKSSKTTLQIKVEDIGQWIEDYTGTASNNNVTDAYCTSLGTKGVGLPLTDDEVKEIFGDSAIKNADVTGQPTPTQLYLKPLGIRSAAPENKVFNITYVTDYANPGVDINATQQVRAFAFIINNTDIYTMQDTAGNCYGSCRFGKTGPYADGTGNGVYHDIQEYVNSVLLYKTGRLYPLQLSKTLS